MSELETYFAQFAGEWAYEKPRAFVAAPVYNIRREVDTTTSKHVYRVYRDGVTIGTTEDDSDESARIAKFIIQRARGETPDYSEGTDIPF